MRTKMLVSMIASTLSLCAANGDLQAADCPPATCENAPAWQQGVKYKKGDRAISVRGNLWECKKTSAKCGDVGHQPDFDAAATDAWVLVDACLSFDGPEVSVTDVVVSSASCNDSITLRALVANDSPFSVPTSVAFYHSASKVLIGVVEVEVPDFNADPPFVQVEMVWNHPTLNSALITVVADDDGTGHGIIHEANEADNTFSTTLATCPGP